MTVERNALVALFVAVTRRPRNNRAARVFHLARDFPKSLCRHRSRRTHRYSNARSTFRIEIPLSIDATPKMGKPVPKTRFLDDRWGRCYRPKRTASRRLKEIDFRNTEEGNPRHRLWFDADCGSSGLPILNAIGWFRFAAHTNLNRDFERPARFSNSVISSALAFAMPCCSVIRLPSERSVAPR